VSRSKHLLEGNDCVYMYCPSCFMAVHTSFDLILTTEIQNDKAVGTRGKATVEIALPPIRECDMFSHS